MHFSIIANLSQSATQLSKYHRSEYLDATLHVFCNISHVGKHALKIFRSKLDFMSMIEYDHHSLVLFERFIYSYSYSQSQYYYSVSPSDKSKLLRSFLLANAKPGLGVTDTYSNKILFLYSGNSFVNRFHGNVCGHVTYSDMRTFLLHNSPWNDAVMHSVSNVVSSCDSCKALVIPRTNRPVFPASLDRRSDDVVSVHFLLKGNTLFHVMVTATKFLAANVVESTNTDEAVLLFESCRLSQFWIPTAIHVDSAFCRRAFVDMMKK